MLQGQDVNYKQLEEGVQLYYDAKDLYYEGKYKSAKAKYNEALEIYTKNLNSPDTLLYKVYNRILRTETKLRNYKLANDAGEKALENAIGVFDPGSNEIMDIYNNLGLLANKENKIQKAINYMEKAIDLSIEKYGMQSVEAAGYMMNNAINYYKKGDYLKSIELNHFAIQIYNEKLKEDDENFNRIYNNLSMLYRKTGDVEKAVQFSQKALEIKLKNYPETHPSVAKYYINLGKAYGRMKNTKEAEKYLKKGYEINNKGFGYNSKEAADNLNEVAGIYIDEGNYEKGLAYYNEIQEILDNLNSDDFFTLQATNEHNIAICKFELGNIEEAILISERLHMKFIKYEDVHEERLIDNLINLSILYREKGDLLSAESTFQKAKKYYSNSSIIDENSLLAIDLLKEECRILMSKNNLSTLKTVGIKISEASETLIKLRKTFVGSDSKEYINEELYSFFNMGVKNALNIYEKEETFENLASIFRNIENAKAASFWDNDSELNAYNLGGVPPEKIDEIESLKSVIEDLKNEASTEKNLTRVKGLNDSLFQKNRTLELAYKSLENDYPKYFEFKYEVESADLGSIQKSLSNDIAMLDYFVFDEEIICVYISNKQAKLLRTKLETDISPFILNQHLKWGKETNNKIYQSLFENIEPLLNSGNISRVSIVPDKFLHFLSFEKIKDPKSYKSLIYDYAFSYQIRAKDIFREKANRGSLSYLGFSPEWSNSESLEDGTQVNRESLIRLPGSRKEVESASGIMRGSILLDDDASEANLKTRVSEFDILHFATHARLDKNNSSNSCLYLSETQQPNSYGQEDGKLFLNEISFLKIKAALVILSACNTGSGILNSGEGIMSLARSFKYAGASAVVMSMWLANDQSSTPIMTEFIRNVKSGQPKDIALQQAKISYLEKADPLMKDDFYWAGFLITGDLYPIGKSSNLNVMLLGLGLLIIILGFAGRKKINIKKVEKN